MRTLISLLCLLAGPAAAQSFYPNLAGARYCSLRSVGVAHEEALTVAMQENWSNTRAPAPMVTVNGQRVTLDAVDLANWVVRCR
jgi:hypothetical protein